MIFSKKYKLSLFLCLLLFACKSSDCGCPMAEEIPVQQKIAKDQKEFHVIVKTD